ncbi:MAG: restriction endonuclease subunit S [Agitococcus sp.]|nr:restriction endonuclease subunit S [Agitococcus sp.]
MSFPRYAAYKDSGVEWLGEVPQGWAVAPLKRSYSVSLGKMLQPELSSPNDTFLPYLRAANIQWAGVDISDVKSMWFSEKEKQHLSLRKNDLLISEGGDVGRSAIWHNELEYCYFQNSINRVRAKNNNVTKYLYYWIYAVKDKGYIDILCNKSTIAHFTAEKVAAIPMPLPTTEEQTTIAAFLDCETAKIDNLINEQKKLIELLKEKRQAVISTAVTKGLNPHAPMKDSGVEWLGEVPEHWSVVPLKYFTNFSGGGTPSRDNLAYWNGDIPWVSPKDMKVERINNTEEYITEHGLKNSSSSLITSGQILIVVRSGILKHTIPVAINDIPVTLNQDMKALCFNKSFCINSFFFRWVQGLNEVLLLAWAKQGATVESIEHNYLAETLIPLPPIEEQSTIVAFLDQETAKIDNLIQQAQKATTLLQERRTALISAAVTGKIDVRNKSLPASLS